MSHRTFFAGLAAPDLGEAPGQVLNGDFIYRNPDIIDQFLRIGAVTHRHDGHLPLGDPRSGVTIALGSGGGLDANTEYFLTYTLLDAQGGETLPAAPVSVVTGTELDAPGFTPSAVVDTTAGIMPDGNYAYALTYTDGAGGETTLGPVRWVFIPPGFASAQVVLSALSQELAPSGQAIEYRLWRSYEGEDWHLVTQSGADTFVDDGFDPPDNPARPPSVGTATTSSASSILATLPDLDAEPPMGSATAIRIYLSTDVDFSNPSFYAQFALPAAIGSSFVIDTFSTVSGSPPDVSTSLLGANKIDPDTDMIDFPWKRPVATTAALPAGDYGDARIVLDTGEIWEVRNPSGAVGPSDWEPVVGGSGGGGGGGTAGGGIAIESFSDGGSQVTGVTSLEIDDTSGSFPPKASVTGTVFDLGGGSALVQLFAPRHSASAVGASATQSGTGYDMYQTQYAGSGMAKIKVDDLSGGSARVTVTAIPPSIHTGDGQAFDAYETTITASAGPSVSVTGDHGKVQVTIPWLGVNVGPSATASAWRSSLTETFPPGVTSDFTDDFGPMIASSDVLTGNDVANNFAHVYMSELHAPGPLGVGSRIRAHFTRLDNTISNWGAVAIGFTNGANLGVAFGVNENMGATWGFDGSLSSAPSTTSGTSAGSNVCGVATNPSDIWLEMWRLGHTVFVAVYTSDPATGASPTFTTSTDTTGTDYDGSAPLYPAVGGKSLGLAGGKLSGMSRLEVFTNSPPGILPFRREVHFAGSGGIGVSVQDIGGGSAQVLIGMPSGFVGATGPAGASGATGATGASGPQGPASIVAVEDGTHRVTPVSDIKFLGAASVTDAGGGSAVVTVTSSGGGGAATVGVDGAGGQGLITPIADVRFIASGGSTVGIVNLGGGSAEVVIGSVTPQTPVIAASAGASAVNPDYYTEYAASGVGLGVSIQNLGGGSARVLIGAAAVVPKSIQASGYVFQPSDVGYVVESASAATAVGYLVPRNADVPIPIDSVIEVFQYGTGQVTVVAASASVVLRSDGNRRAVAGQFGTIALRKRDTDEWVLSGDLG